MFPIFRYGMRGMDTERFYKRHTQSATAQQSIHRRRPPSMRSAKSGFFLLARIRPFGTMSRISSLDDLPDVDIDTGRFKYILIKVSDGDKTKNIVRGYKWASYHADIYDVVAPENTKFKYECPGGGRIEHSPQKRQIKVYGYSQGFGLADHKLTCEMLKEKYPDYDITWSNEGY